MSINRDDEIGGLWAKTSSRGEEFWSGKINGQEVVIFRNKFKQPGERSPDLRVYKSQPRETQQQQTHPGAQNVRRELERQGYDVERASVDRGPKGGRSRDELSDDVPFSAETRA